MALFRKIFCGKPPEGLLEISERVYVFDFCFSKNLLEGNEYEAYIGRVVNQLHDYFPDASFIVFSFGNAAQQKQITNVLSKYNITLIDYPSHYENCPLLTVEMIHHFLRSSESWLCIGQKNVILMQCHKGAFPVLAFMLASFLIYRKQSTGEKTTLDMVYRQASQELLHSSSSLNPLPSQLRYLQYVSRRNIGSRWPPLDRALTLDCVILRAIPDMDGRGGCRPIFRVYGPDPLMAADRKPKLLFSMPKKSRGVGYFKQAESELVKIDINCHVQGDVVIECFTLDDNLEHEQIMFRVVFNTAFIRSNVLILNCEEIDTMWNVMDQFPKDFLAEVIFYDMDSSSSLVVPDFTGVEDIEGLPIEAFATIQEMFNNLHWGDPEGDNGRNIIQQITVSSILEEKHELTSFSSARIENSPQSGFFEARPTVVEGLKSKEVENESSSPSAASKSSLDSEYTAKKIESSELHVSVQRPAQSKILSARIHQTSPPNQSSLSSSSQGSSIALSRYHSAPSAVGITALLHDSEFSDKEVSSALSPESSILPSAPSVLQPVQPTNSSVSQPEKHHVDSKSGSGAPPPPPPPRPILLSTRLLIRKPQIQQSKKKSLKRYHWWKFTRARQGSLWAEAKKPEEAAKAPELDLSELESLFSANVPNSDHGGSSGKTNWGGSGLKSDKVHLIALGRACSCEIMLTKVKIPLSDLMNFVLALDDSAPDIDQVDNLIKFCPTKEEIELLKNYKGDKENLGKCEQFFLELMKVPRVESKLRVFSFKIQFFSQVSDLRNSLNVINSASEEVRNSVKLKRIMQTILSLGNALNHGTARGSAVGFRLDSLPKLAETRARNNKLTLIHYLCKVLASKLPEVLDFHEDLVSLEAATKIQLKYLAEEMQAISKGIEKVIQELAASENDGAVSENFCKTLKDFWGYAEAHVRSLASLYSGVGRNADALALYFGEDPARCPFEQVVSTLLNFVRMFKRAHEENCKQLEFEKKKKKAQEEAEIAKAKPNSTSKKELAADSIMEATFKKTLLLSDHTIANVPNSDHRGSSGKTNSGGSGLKSDKVHLIELRRAYNCEIMLTEVKIPLSDLMNSVLALDDSALDIDQVDNLIKFCPTKEEIELLKNYKGDKENLGKCEQFFLELMKVPRVESKLRVFSFKIQFCSQVSDLRNSLNVINSASEEVRNSVKLKRIMQTILSLGNALNHGTARGSAVGFRLDSLPKLAETRARNNKLTLIHYLCKVLASKLPEVLDFYEDLVSLEAATKIQLKYLAEEMQAISKAIEKVIQELAASENDGAVSENFGKTLKDFLGSAEAQVRSLASLYSGVGRNADALALYFGEDPARCPFEQVVSTLLNFVRMFKRAHEENCKQLEFEKKKKTQEEAEIAKAKPNSTSKKEFAADSIMEANFKKTNTDLGH